MKRNIVILLCLVFFTQSAFADVDFLCNDCNRRYDKCYEHNQGWQKLHKAEASKIKELEARVEELEAQNKNLKIGVGVGALAVGYILHTLYQPVRVIRDLIVRVTRSGYVDQGTSDNDVNGDQS
jgi:hypothetical protein